MRAAVYLRAQAYNNAWANHRLLHACGHLSRQDLHAKRTGFFPSIIHTLNHNLTVDRFYVSALEGHSVGPAAFDPAIPCPEIDDLKREQQSVDRRLVTLCEGLSEDELSRPVNLIRETWVQVERVDRTLLHLFQHQVHHRGQVHTMLAGTAVQPPQLDEFFLAAAEEQGLRRDDFVELGFSEETIWRE